MCRVFGNKSKGVIFEILYPNDTISFASLACVAGSVCYIYVYDIDY